MSRTQYFKNNFTGGVIDPRLAGRIELAQWNNGLLTGENIVTIPQGGIRRRPGLKYIDAVSRVLSRITSGITIAAVNGGTTANANDDDTSTVVLTTNNVSTTNPYVAVQYTRASAVDKVLYADVVGISLTAGSSDEFVIQSSANGSAWTTEMALALVDTTPRTYRVRVAGTSRLYWRVARVGATDLGTAKVSIQEFHLWSSSVSGTLNAVSDSRLFSFLFNDETEYLLCATDLNIRIYAAGVEVANVRTPYLSAELADLDFTQSANTGIMVHENHAPQRLLRSSATTWYFSDLTLTGVPQFDYNDDDSPTPTNHVLTLTFSGGAWDDGDRFKIVIDGAVTSDIVFAGDSNSDEQDTTSENIRKAVQALPTVGLAGVGVARTGGTVHTITFSEDSAKDYSNLVSAYATSGSSSNRLTIAHTTPGSPRTEDVWSADRGWPRSATFHEGRLYFFGTLSQPASLFGSVANDYFNFEVGEGRDDEGIFVTLNTDQLNAGQAIFSGRSLQLFTGGAEFFVPDRPITPSLTVQQQTRYGSIRRKPITIDGSTMYVQRTGKVVREFVFDFNEDAHVSPPLSVVAPHLLNDVRAMTAWEGDGQDDTNLALFVNGDGTMAVLNTLRAQSISAWSKWTTDGDFRDVVSVDEALYCTVDRVIDGDTVTFIEEFSKSYYTDAGYIGTTGVDGTLSVGHLSEDEAVVVRSGNRSLGDYTLSAYTLDLGDTHGSESVEVGLEFLPSFTLLSPGGATENGESWPKKKRAVRVLVYATNTLGLRVYDGNETRAIPDFVLNDTPLGGDPTLLTEFREISVTTGWKRELTIRLEQASPLPMMVLAVEVEVEVGDR